MRTLILLLLILSSVWDSRCVAQQPGDLDNSFGTGGMVVMHYAPWTDMTIQPDGKILAVSDVIARYKIDGTLDSSFGVNGIDTIRIDSMSQVVGSAIALQPDGKILIAAGPVYVNTDLKDFLLIRYNTDGSLDSSFGGDGFALADINSGSDDYSYEVVVQADGKIIVSGASDQKLALCRYNSNGSLDSTFDYDGKLILNDINIGFSSNWSHATYMKLQADEKILAGSSSLFARLNPDGSLDNSFGNNGLKGLPASMNDLAIQPDGKIVLAGGGGDFVIIRLDSSGNFDNNFGTGGVTTTSAGMPNCSNPGHMATSVTLQPDGRILAGGYNWCCLLHDCREFVLMRYNEDGSPDSTFNSDGKVTTGFFEFSSESHASAITPDLKLVLAGYSYYFDYGGLARYHLGTMLDVKNLPVASGNIIIAPNPTRDRITIKASAIENGTWRIEILDQTGRSLLRESVTVNSNSLQKEVSLNRLEDGMYFLKMTGAHQQMTYKVVKGE